MCVCSTLFVHLFESVKIDINKSVINANKSLAAKQKTLCVKEFKRIYQKLRENIMVKIRTHTDSYTFTNKRNGTEIHTERDNGTQTRNKRQK